MDQSLPMVRAPSIVPTATSGSEFAPTWQRILSEAHRVWPRYTAKVLARITGAGVRTCYRWLAHGAKPSAEAILKIIVALRADYDLRGKMLQQFELDLR